MAITDEGRREPGENLHQESRPKNPEIQIYFTPTILQPAYTTNPPQYFKFNHYGYNRRRTS